MSPCERYAIITVESLHFQKYQTYNIPQFSIHSTMHFTARTVLSCSLPRSFQAIGSFLGTLTVTKCTITPLVHGLSNIQHQLYHPPAFLEIPM